MEAGRSFSVLRGKLCFDVGFWRRESGFGLSGSWSDDDFESKRFQAVCVIPLESFGGLAVEVIGSEVLILLVIFQDMVEDNQ